MENDDQIGKEKIMKDTGSGTLTADWRVNWHKLYSQVDHKSFQ